MHAGSSTTAWLGNCPLPAEARLQAEHLFQRNRCAHWSQIDRRFSLFMVVQSIVAMGAICRGTWQAWDRPFAGIAGAVAIVLVFGLFGALPTALARRKPGRPITRHAMAVLQSVAAIAWVHFCGDADASHFLTFASFALVACYQDGRVLLTAFATTVVCCGLCAAGWPLEPGAAEEGGLPWIVRLAWLTPEIAFLAIYGRTSTHDVRSAIDRHAALEHGSAAFERAMHQHTAELRAGEARTRSILETAADAIITFGTNGNVTSWNRAAEVMFNGFDASKPFPMRALFPHPYEGVFSEILTEVLSGEGAEHLGSWREMKARRRSGEVIDVEFSMCEARTDESLFFTAVFHDISDRKVVERLSHQYAEELNQARIINELNETRLREAVSDLEAARIRAEEANRSKSDFLAAVSHEIRTPMNGILGMADLALEGNLSDEQRDYLETIRGSGESLLEIINDLLDLSKIEAGKIELCQAPFSLRGTLAAMISPLAMRAHQKGLELIYRVAPNVPDALFGDDLRLRQVLINLIGNAIKFTPRGEVTVECRCNGRVEPGGFAPLQFDIRDTGIGISAEARQRLFHAFSQADASTARKYGGTGLGLSISAKLARMMGGELSVDSVEGAGSTFSLSLMLCWIPEEEGAAVPTEFAGTDATPVLIVDDSRPAGDALKETLVAWGMQPTPCVSADEALSTLAELPPHERRQCVMMIDTHLPKDGARQVVETLQRGAIPVRGIVLMHPVGLRTASLPASMAGLNMIEKPVTHDTLRQALGEVLGVAVQRRAAARPGVAAMPGLSDLGPLRVLLVEDNVVNRKLATRILQSRRHGVETASNGNEAVAAVFESEFDVVLMDVQMPEKDGLEATREIRAREETLGRHVPIIAMTAHALRGDRETCLAAGMDDYLTKPIRPDDVFDALGRIMARFPRRERNETTQRAAPAIEGTVREPEPVESYREVVRNESEPYVIVDLALLKDRTCADPDFLREIVELFLRESPGLFNEVVRAVDAADAHRINRSAHALKGSMGTYCLTGPYDAALRLEQAGGRNEMDQAPELLATLKSEYDRLCGELKRILSDPELASAAEPAGALVH